MNTEKKQKVKKVLKVVGTCLGVTAITSIASVVSYKLGKNSIDREQIEADFIANSVSDQYNGRSEKIWRVMNCNGAVYAKWDISETKPDNFESEYTELPGKVVTLDEPIM